MACVDVPALPLQLLMRRHPAWAAQPAAVVDRDRPQGIVEWVNEAARRAGVLPGMSYAAGLSLAGGLRAAEVPPGDVEAGVAAIAGLLRRFTPGVEPSVAQPGVFWLDASGLQPLFVSLVDWGRGVRAHLRAAGFRGRVVVGFTRFGTYALAR
ncbi:MAG: DNA polymerase Y family protein, partial [Acidobacteria bacterium]|nr:DNA polymerase Y family protein [Acidobacteriota bacterium]